MYSKQYLLLTILFTTIILSLYANANEEKSGRSGAANQDDDDADGDDQQSGSSSSGSGRQPPYNVADVGFRIRPRRPLQVIPPLPEVYRSRMDWAQLMNRNMAPPPSPPLSFNNNPMYNMGSSCKSLIDPQYPIFSDMCGAVPQALYGLPNTFGHYDRWQLAHLLTTLIGSATDPVCIRSLRHLLCPMLFQPCRVRHEPPLVLPCQSYCRAVKIQCGIPALDAIPCELLPYASDICPNIEPYVSVMTPGFSPVGTQPETTQNAFPSTDQQQTARSFASQSFKQAVPSPSTVSTMQTQSPVYAYHRRQYGNEGANDYRPGLKYTPSAQSTFKTHSSVDLHTSNDARGPSGPVPSAVKP